MGSPRRKKTVEVRSFGYKVTIETIQEVAQGLHRSDQTSLTNMDHYIHNYILNMYIQTCLQKLLLLFYKYLNS